MRKFLVVFGPGFLVAATGVGAGDLATSALAGSRAGIVVISAVIIGGLFKYLLNEGLARWQFCTGTTLIEGAMRYYGRMVQYLFMMYLVVWSFSVAGALMSASGVALYAMIPIFEQPATGKMVFGLLLSLLGIILVRMGGFRFFERMMTGAVLVMLFTVFYAAGQLSTDLQLSGPSLEVWRMEGQEVEWYLAVLGGVGGTVTILCYGYWIREHGRTGEAGLRISRIDLFLAYLVTVLLGISMVIIGSRIQVDGGGAGLLVQLSVILDQEAGLLGGWLFRIGAFAAIYSSLLGVWQSVPYLFANLLKLSGNQEVGLEITTGSKSYRLCLYLLATVPAMGLFLEFAAMQKFYALCGAAFIPLLALTLILLHFQSDEYRKAYRNTLLVNVIYGLIFLFFVWLFIQTLVF